MAWWKNGALVAAASLAVAAVVCAGVAAASSKFDDVVQPSWANDHVLYEDDLLKLRLDSSSGKICRLTSQWRAHLFTSDNVPVLSLIISSFLHFGFNRRGIRVQEQVLVRQGDRRSEARAGGLRRRRHCFLCE